METEEKIISEENLEDQKKNVEEKVDSFEEVIPESNFQEQTIQEEL